MDNLERTIESIHLSVRFWAAKIVDCSLRDDVDVCRIMEDFGTWECWRQCVETAFRFKHAVDLIHQLDKWKPCPAAIECCKNSRHMLEEIEG